MKDKGDLQAKKVNQGGKCEQGKVVDWFEVKHVEDVKKLIEEKRREKRKEKKKRKKEKGIRFFFTTEWRTRPR